MPSVRLITLGKPCVWVDGNRISLGRKDIALFSYVALSRTPSRREFLADLLWGDGSPQNVRQSLRQSLHHLRQAVGDILVTDETISFNPGAYEIDALVLQENVNSRRFAEAVETYSGDFLEGYEDLAGESFRAWLDAERTGIRLRVEWSLDQLIVQCERGGPEQDILRWTEKRAKLSPFDEKANGDLVRALHHTGRSGDALAHARRFKATFEGELGQSLSANFLGVLAAIQREQPSQKSANVSSSLIFSPDMVGRDREFGELKEAWHAVVAGGSARVWIVGDLGTGKTRLCHEFIAWARRDNNAAVILRVAARNVVGADGAAARIMLSELDTAPGLLGSSPEALAQVGHMVPSIRERLRLPRVSGEGDEFREGIRQVLEDVAAESPIIVLMDDVAVADDTSRRLLLHLAKHPTNGVMLIVTGRVEEAIALGAPDGTSHGANDKRITLRPLTVGQTRSLLDSMLAVEKSAAASLVSQLHSQTGGNPYYIIEVVNGLVEEGHLAPDHSGTWTGPSGSSPRAFPIPPSVLSAVHRRVESLGVNAAGILSAATVLGSGFDAAVAQKLAELSDFERDAGVSELIERRFIRESSSRPGHFDFAQDLVRRVASERLAPKRRAQLHQAAAEIFSSDKSLFGHHRARAKLSPVPSKRFLVIAGIGAIAFFLTLGMFFRFRAPPAVTPGRVAVLPFIVRGGVGAAYLGEGLAQLIAIAIDGVGDIRTVDTRVLFSAANVTSSAKSEAIGEEIAKRFGAAQYVLGDITIGGERIRISAALYSVNAPQSPVTHVSIEGTEREIFEAADRLASKLIAAHLNTPAERTARVATATTRSLPALKAYLNGERALRQGRFDDATDAYAAAVREDSLFALAYWRLKVAAEWALREDMVALGAKGASLYRDQLPQHERQILKGYELEPRYPAAAEQQYRAIINEYPNDIETWFRLGETKFHWGPVQGRPFQLSQSAFEKVLSLDGLHNGAILHLGRIASVDGKKLWLDSLINRARSARMEVHELLELRALRTFRFGTVPEQKLLLAELRSWPDERLIVLSRIVGVYTRNLRGTREIVRLLTEADRPLMTRAHGFGLLARLDVALGQVRAMHSDLARSWQLDPGSSAEIKAGIVTLPFIRPHNEMLRRAHRELREHPGPDSFPGWARTHDKALIDQSWELAFLSARLGDSVQASKYVGNLLTSRQSKRFARQIIALYQFDRGNLGETLKILADTSVDVGLSTESYTIERMLRAETLFRAGKFADAERWYASFPEFFGNDFPILAISQLRLGEIYDRLRRREEAVAAYSRFLEMWADCDIEYRPLLEQTRRRLIALQ